jgi:hypothetical protein
MSRIFGFVGVLLAAGIVLYLYTRQAQTVSQLSGGGTLQSAGVLTGVKGDLIGIANAERGFNAEQGRYGSWDELLSGHYITMKSERPPYGYEVETTSSGFRITARRSGPGSPAQLWIDESMQIQSSD